MSNYRRLSIGARRRTPPVARATKIDAATMSGPYYTAIPASPVLDATSSSKVTALAGVTDKLAILSWTTACFAIPSDPSYNIVYDQDPLVQPGQIYDWAYGNRALSAEEYDPVRIPDPPNFYPMPGGYADGAGWDGWGAIIDPVRGIGFTGWRMAKVSGQWQAATSGAFAVPGDFTSMLAGGGRADGLPPVAGSITVQEAEAAAADTTGTYTFPHALALQVPVTISDTAFRAPALSTDGTVAPSSATVSHGMRFYLPSTATTASTNKIIQAIVRTLKIYGAYVTDRTGGPINVIFERFNPAAPSDMVDPNTGAATTLDNPAAIAGGYYRNGIQWDYFSLSEVPWSSLSLLKQWDGGGTPTFNQLVEDWSTGIDTAKWDALGATVSGGVLSIPANTTYAEYVQSQSYYDLANSSVYAEVVPSTGPGTREAYMVLSSAVGDELTIGHNGTSLYCQYRIGSGGTPTSIATMTYSATTHRWWRIRHNGTQVIFDTSPDRVTWTQLGAWTPAFAVTQLQVMFGAGQYGGDGTSLTPAKIDNINYATFSPTSISGLGLWYDASTLTDAEGTLLSTLSDLSGNGRHATQSGTARPTVRAASVNGKTSLEFLGTQSMVTASYIPQTGAGTRTVFVVLRDVALGTNAALNHVYHYGTNTALAAYGMASRVASVMRFGAHYWNGTMTNGPTNTTGVTYVLHQKYDGTTDRLYNGMTEVGSSVRALVTGSTTPFRLGTSVANGEFGRFRLCEIAVWPRELTTTERQDTVNYLTAKWGA